jgi:hypothetical protein
MNATRLNAIGPNPAALVKKGIERGWIRIRMTAEEQKKLVLLDAREYDRQFHKNQRSNRVAVGLTCAGQKRTYQKRPQLAGMSRKDYHRNYMRMIRVRKS